MRILGKRVWQSEVKFCITWGDLIKIISLAWGPESWKGSNPRSWVMLPVFLWWFLRPGLTPGRTHIDLQEADRHQEYDILFSVAGPHYHLNALFSHVILWQLPHSCSLLKTLWEEMAALKCLWKVTNQFLRSKVLKETQRTFPDVPKGRRTGRKSSKLHLWALSSLGSQITWSRPDRRPHFFHRW